MFKWLNFFKKDKTPTGNTTPTDANTDTPFSTPIPSGNLLSSGSPLNNTSAINNPDMIASNTTNPLSDTHTINNSTSPLSATTPVTNTTTPLTVTPPVTNTTNTTTPLTVTPSVTNTTTPLTVASPVPNTTPPLTVASPVTNTATPVEPAISDINNIDVAPATISQDVNKISSIAMQIKALPLFTSIGDVIISEISTSGFLSSTSLNYIIENGQKIIDNSSSNSGNNTEIDQYISAIDEMLKLPPLDKSLDHDNLVESNITSTVQNIVKYYNVCEKSISLSSNQSLKSEFAVLTPVVSEISSNFTNFISVFKNFKSSEHNLRQEIEAYTNAVTKIQGQGVNIDWGGKKEAFEQKGAELTTRRNAYVEEEKQINAQITTLSNTISSFYPTLISFLNNLKSDLSSQSTDSESNIYQDQINSYIQYSTALKSIVNNI